MKHLALALAVSAALVAGCKEEPKKPEPAKTETPAPAATSEAPKTEAPATASEAPKADAAAAALDGAYKGVLPCASCEGIETTLVLKDGMAYELTTLFLGEPDAKPETVSGSYTRDGDLIRLDAAADGDTYFVGESLLEMRDKDGSTGGRSEEQNAAYRLQKQ